MTQSFWKTTFLILPTASQSWRSKNVPHPSLHTDLRYITGCPKVTIFCTSVRDTKWRRRTANVTFTAVRDIAKSASAWRHTAGFMIVHRSNNDPNDPLAGHTGLRSNPTRPTRPSYWEEFQELWPWGSWQHAFFLLSSHIRDWLFLWCCDVSGMDASYHFLCIMPSFR